MNENQISHERGLAIEYVDRNYPGISDTLRDWLIDAYLEGYNKAVENILNDEIERG